jgi:hypothetical protein
MSTSCLQASSSSRDQCTSRHPLPGGSTGECGTAKGNGQAGQGVAFLPMPAERSMPDPLPDPNNPQPAPGNPNPEPARPPPAPPERPQPDEPPGVPPPSPNPIPAPGEEPVQIPPGTPPEIPSEPGFPAPTALARGRLPASAHEAGAGCVAFLGRDNRPAGGNLRIASTNRNPSIPVGRDPNKELQRASLV